MKFNASNPIYTCLGAHSIFIHLKDKFVNSTCIEAEALKEKSRSYERPFPIKPN